ncbi:MAG: chemotaxis protein MotB [Myxococcota bacterium]|jgi:chemotaxis protein MotB
MRRSHKRSPELSVIIKPSKATWLCVTCVSLVAFGCVTSSTHNEVVAERDRLALESAAVGDLAGKLEVSNASLEAERVRIYDELEDLRIEREALTQARAQLEGDVSRLSENESELNEQLQETSAALSAATEDVRDLQSTYQGLVTDLESELQKGAIEIEQLRSGLRVAVSDEILFRSGSAKLDKEGAALLEKVAANVSKLDYAIDVEGHTDNIPIRGSLTKQYPSNWELAGARASSVVRLFERVGIDGKRLQAISRAEFAPVASNDSSANRSINRRIEIRLRPREDSDVKTDVTEGIKESVVPKPAATDARTAPVN